MAAQNKSQADDAEDKEVPAAPKQKSPVMKIVLIVVGVLVLIGVSVGVSIFAVKSMTNHSASADGKPVEEGGKESGKDKEKKPSVYYAFDPAFVVNFQGEGGPRFLQVTVEVMTDDPEVVPVIEAHKPVIRNNLVMLFSNQSYENMITLEGKQRMRAEALAEIQKVIEKESGKPGIKEVYFTSFVMQ